MTPLRQLSDGTAKINNLFEHTLGPAAMLVTSQCASLQFHLTILKSNVCSIVLFMTISMDRFPVSIAGYRSNYLKLNWRFRILLQIMSMISLSVESQKLVSWSQSSHLDSYSYCNSFIFAFSCSLKIPLFISGF